MNRINQKQIINTFASPYRTQFAEIRRTDQKKEKVAAAEIKRIELSPYMLIVV